MRQGTNGRKKHRIHQYLGVEITSGDKTRNVSKKFNRIATSGYNKNKENRICRNNKKTQTRYKEITRKITKKTRSVSGNAKLKRKEEIYKRTRKNDEAVSGR